MRANILPLLLISAMTFGGAAFAGTTATTTTTAPAATTAAVAAPAASMAAMTPTTTKGTIKSIDTKSLSVTLTNGSRYHFAKGFAFSNFKVGEKVSIVWEWKSKKHTASAMSAA